MSKRSNTVRKSAAATSSIPKYAGDDAEDYNDFTPYAAKSYKPKRRIIYDDKDTDFYSDSDWGEPRDASEVALEWAEKQSWLAEQRWIRNDAARVIQAWWRNEQQKKRNNAARVIQACWRRCVSCPDYNVARRRLQREFLEMMDD
jgi:hypothetical protein